MLIGQLLNLRGTQARVRAAELLRDFELTAAGQAAGQVLPGRRAPG
ncbi:MULTISPECIES: hypothetical protein [Saccharothrix]|nr:hypothetical protein [Saccharothrix sp. CB00851]